MSRFLDPSGLILRSENIIARQDRDMSNNNNNKNDSDSDGLGGYKDLNIVMGDESAILIVDDRYVIAIIRTIVMVIHTFNV